SISRDFLTAVYTEIFTPSLPPRSDNAASPITQRSTLFRPRNQTDHTQIKPTVSADTAFLSDVVVVFIDSFSVVCSISI
ncbi:hypothetical protein, partial [Methylobacter sp.]|uniref:hypothetical protein n=1 Tax=Methylobacter sp. TaxID=2051955 RepID=UPI002487A425